MLTSWKKKIMNNFLNETDRTEQGMDSDESYSAHSFDFSGTCGTC